MNPGFQGVFKGSTLDGENFVGLDYFYYLTKDGRLLRLVIGFTTDGPSEPKFGEVELTRTGKKWFPGVLHDGLYRNYAQIYHDGVWHPFVVTKEECDSFFREALLLHGVEEWESDVLYEAVKKFGQSSFDEDRKKRPAPPEAMPDVGEFVALQVVQLPPPGT